MLSFKLSKPHILHSNNDNYCCLFWFCLYVIFYCKCDVFSSAQLLLSRVRIFATPWTAAHQTSLSFTMSQGLLKLMSIESVMPSNHLFLCHPLFLLPSIFPSSRVFLMSRFFASGVQSTESFSFIVSLSNEYSGLISFRMDWLDLLAVQGTRKSLL